MSTIRAEKTKFFTFAYAQQSSSGRVLIQVPYRPIPFEKDLPVLVSHFSLLRDERKERESARVE